MTWWQGLIGAAGVTLVPLLTWLSAKASARNGSKSADTADWSAFMSEQREWVEDMMSERDSRIDRLEVRLEAVESKYRVAVTYIRRLVRQLQKHVDPDEIETPPPEIHPDL